jgi:NAD+ synthase (glutamine-hydrolysing)
MKIALAQINYHIGNFESNTGKIIGAIRKAKEQHADLVIFAEMAVCGYPPRDFLEFRDFISQCSDSIDTIAKECSGIAAVVGAPSVNPDKEGKDLFNTAYFLEDGKIKKQVHKTLLPTYDIFDEYRYFEPNKKFETILFKGKRIALTICEDLWNISENPLYTVCPMDEMMNDNPDLMINIAASPFHYKQAEIRKEMLRKNAVKYGIPLLYVNHVGAQTELIFDGGSLAMNASGAVVEELTCFTEDMKIVDLDKMAASPNNNPAKEKQSEVELIYAALVTGIKDYFGKLDFKKAVLGLSGGIDSAVTLVLAERALGKENVHAILMPSQFSSGHSVDDARKLAENLNIAYDIISIEKAYESISTSLSPFFKDLPFNITEENIQARIRAVFLMAFCNKFGYILLNTSNKSEAAVGYGTLYGDMCGGISVLGDLYKTQVYELAHFINSEKEIIPHHTVIKPPSAELRPNQKDTDSLPDYAILDKLLYLYIEQRQGPKEIMEQGFDKKLVDRVLKMVNTNEYKRHQTPPILRISPKAFGMGRRMPIVGKYLS